VQDLETRTEGVFVFFDDGGFSSVLVLWGLSTITSCLSTITNFFTTRFA
jgi:hypothetical protein